MNFRIVKNIFLSIIATSFFVSNSYGQYPEIETELEQKIKDFLTENTNEWRDMNVPLSDGKILFDLIVDNNYTQAVEIGTSTGHSAIWMAWALSKTGGKLITIEIDKRRYLQAKANFAKAGVEEFIDARLADAHELVPKLPGEYDFVFSDADKYWYTNYFKAMAPKLKPGGCFTAHNTNMRMPSIKEFVEYIEGREDFKTTYAGDSRSGISISCKIEKE